MRRALRVTGGIALALALAGFFLVLWASLQVRRAVDDGALAGPVWSCITPPDAQRPDVLADRAFVRSIQTHLAGSGATGTAWHWNGLIALIGTRALYTAEEREQAMRPRLARLPVCPTRAAA